MAFTTAARRSLGIGLILLLGACAAPGPRGDRPTGAQAEGVAESYYRIGRYRDAAAAFEDLAIRTPARRDHWLLRAADAAWQSGDPALTLDYVSRIDVARLPRQNQALADLLRAATLPATLSAAELLGTLDFMPDRLPETYRPLFHQLRAEALLNAGQPYTSALERIALAAYLIDPTLAADNRERILRTLQELSSAQARRLMGRHQVTDEMYGWLDLIASLKEAVFSHRSTGQVIADWERRYPNHPAGREATRSLLAAYDRSFTQPTSLALLVPLSGPLNAAGQAVLDGFMAAYFGGERQATVKVYDTGSSAATASQAYHRALAEGAGYVVGPLDRDAVTAIVLEADGAVPILALNYSSSDAPPAPNVYQLGLLPEDEAVAAAERMLADGHARSVVLVPDSAWGRRLSGAFVDHFQYLGGAVLENAIYPDGIGDYGAIIERILGLDAGVERRRRLQGQLGVRLGYVPHPRHDLDAMFIGGRPREGRLINPQLAFHNAGALPVYSTSHVYSGTPDPVADRDLNDIRFCDAPWLIDSQEFPLSLERARRVFDSATGTRARLFATGYDAFRILPYLQWLSGLSGDHYPGLTGQLAVTEGGRIQRRPECAVFRSGRPQPLDPIAEPIGP